MGLRVKALVERLEHPHIQDYLRRSFPQISLISCKLESTLTTIASLYIQIGLLYTNHGKKNSLIIWDNDSVIKANINK
jgi:hypothetical protein